MDWDDDYYDPFEEPLDRPGRNSAFNERFFRNSTPRQPATAQPVGVRRKSTAALLFLFLGPTGAGNLYMRQNVRAVTKLVLFFLMMSAGLTLVGILFSALVLPVLILWSFIEFILVLTGSAGYDRDGHGLPLR